jgi:PKD repeat protein
VILLLTTIDGHNRHTKIKASEKSIKEFNMARSLLFSSIRVIAFILVFVGAFCITATADVLSDNGFSGSPRVGCAPLTVTFSDDSSGATSWLWYFGDGGSSIAQHPVHTYTQPGFYSVTRIATQTRTQSSTKLLRNYIVVYVIPAVNFRAVPTTGVPPLTVQFYDQSQGAYSWSWDFGDGAQSTAKDPQHTYSAPGSYTVSLTVNNICGTKTAQKDNYVIVKGPKIDISHQNLALANGASYDFGPTNIGYVSTAEFQIENKGSGSLQLTSSPPVRVTGPDAQYFEVVSQPALLSMWALIAQLSKLPAMIPIKTLT